MKTYQSIAAWLGCGLLTALSTIPSAKADYSSTVLSQNPAAYYRLNETVSPIAFHATNSGTLGSSADGSFNNLPSVGLPGPFAGSVAVGFDGVSQTVTNAYQAALNPSTFTIEIWVNPTSATVSGGLLCVAASMHSGSPRSGWLIYQSDGTAAGAAGVGYYLRMYAQNGSAISIGLLAPQTPTPGTWTHLVYTFDGTTAKAYINGALVNSGTPTGYVPNVDAAFTVGARSDNGFLWPGEAAETAFYGTALSAARINAHYIAATTTPASYASSVLADAPLLFDRYVTPPSPTVANSGTLGIAGNGLFIADAVAGAPGPQSPKYPGFEATNKAAAFDAQGGSVRLPAFNFNTNTITISGWVNASNLQQTAAGIVVCHAGTTYSGLTIDGVSGGLGIGYVWNNDASTYNWSPTTDAGLIQLPNSDWAYVALVVQPNEADLYIATTNGAGSFSSATNTFVHIKQAFDGATLIGTDAGQPALSFNGAIDEVGIWNRSLSSGELYSQYASAVGGLKPIVFGDPPSPSQPIVAGDTLTLTVNVGGTPLLSYQWLSNSVPIGGATNSVYIKPNFSIAADSGSYQVIVTNLYGSATSGVATVTGQIATAPVLISQPVSATIYPGGVLNLPVVATGGGLQFNWQLNGTNIPGATSATYFVGSVTNVNAGVYTLGITNSLGGITIKPIVITIPTLTPGTYAAVVDADAPDSWWRLDESSITNGTILADAMGRHSGAYTNNGGLTVASPGAIAGNLAGTALTFSGDGSYGYVPYFSDLSAAKFSLELWARQATVVNNVTVASSDDSSGNGFGIGAESTWQGITGTQVFGQPLGSQAAGNPNWDPTIYPGQWVHIVVIYNPGANASFPYQLWVNGSTDGFIWGGNPLNNIAPFIIGGTGTGDASVVKNDFIGSVDEVAFYNKILSSSQIQAHYAAAFFGIGPSFSVQPQSQNAFAGQNITLNATAVGAPTIAVQWKKNGVSLVGQTNSTLTVSNVFYTTSSDIYTVFATNLYGTATSSNAVITVYAPPTWANLTNGLVLHLAFDTSYGDSSGRGNNGTPVGSPTFVPGKIGDALNVLTDTTNAIYNYVTLGNPADFQFGASGDFSVSYWVQFPSNAIPGDLPFLCNAATSTGGWGLTIAPAYKTGGWAWSIDNSAKVGTGVQGPANTINDGAWHNVVETFTRAGNCTTYLDGAPVSSVPIIGVGDIDSGQPYNIGQDPTGTYSESGTYSLDDMGVWTRALGDIEARSIYAVGQNYGKSFNTTGTVSLTLFPAGGGKYGIAWQAGTLLQAATVTGPWTPVPGATLPVFQFTPTGTNNFFKVGP